MSDRELFASCGVYCGVCPQHIADKYNNDKLKEKLAANFGVKPEEIKCQGCKSESPFLFCSSCTIRACTQEKNIDTCAQCNDYPCDTIENFPIKPFLQKLKWDVDFQKQHGEDKWVDETIKINSCPSCQTLNHWKARRCISCKSDLPERY